MDRDQCVALMAAIMFAPSDPNIQGPSIDQALEWARYIADKTMGPDMEER